MQVLNFPPYQFRFKNSENIMHIFDEIRKKYIKLTPEEWVRQHVLHFLVSDKQYSKSLINVEKKIELNGRIKRYDLVVYNSDGSVKILVECKAPDVKITQNVFDQIARYNRALESEYLIVTNGMEHYYCKMDFLNGKYVFLRDIPNFIKE